MTPVRACFLTLALLLTTGGLAMALSPSVTNVTVLQRVAMNLAQKQRPDGAIIYTDDRIQPYFANIAAAGALRTGMTTVDVKAWMRWYVARSAEPNPWRIAGAITDYAIAENGAIRSTNEADSIDSYAATFVSLTATAWLVGDTSTRAYVTGIHHDIERIAGAIDAVRDRDGLTWALPGYRLKYLMDNSEVYQGLVDLAMLRREAFGDLAGAIQASSQAMQIKAAINAGYWDAKRGIFALALDENGAYVWPEPGDFMEDGTAQLFPILHGVVDPASQPAQAAYHRFSVKFPTWPTLVKPDEFPWASVGFVALQMGDLARARTYAASVQHQYGDAFPYPWYCAESGWYLRLLAGLEELNA